MTTLAVTVTSPTGDQLVKKFVWGAQANGDDGAVVGPDWSSYPDRSVQVTGTFGAAGSVSWEGSNDGSNWAVLTTPAGGAVTFTAAGLKQVLEGSLYARPHVTAGDGTTSLVVTLFARRSTHGRV
jgi:hypothetical protein